MGVQDITAGQCWINWVSFFDNCAEHCQKGNGGRGVREEVYLNQNTIQTDKNTKMKYNSYGIYLCTKGFVVLYYVQILYLPHRRATLYKPCTYSTTLLALKKVQNPRNEAAILVLQSHAHLHMYTKPNAFT